LNAAPASLRLVGFDAEKNNKNMLVCRASYPVSGGAVAGCADVTKALAAGVESFLNKLYSDPRFAELFAQ
jgi:hypothetical protein